MGKGAPLSFLNKKPWHPTRVQNLEEKWKREQKAAAEQKKLEELKQQYEEERRNTEFLQIAHASGHLKNTDRLDWMYAGSLAAKEDAAKRQEEALLGQRAAPLSNAQAQDASRIEVASTLGGTQGVAGGAPTSQSEQWQRLNNDPLLLIKKQQQEQVKKVVENPVKMQDILRQVQQQQAAKKEKEKKHKKHKKEHKKKERRHRDSDSGSTSSEGEARAARAEPHAVAREDGHRGAPHMQQHQGRARSRSPPPVLDRGGRDGGAPHRYEGQRQGGYDRCGHDWDTRGQQDMRGRGEHQRNHGDWAREHRDGRHVEDRERQHDRERERDRRDGDYARSHKGEHGDGHGARERGRGERERSRERQQDRAGRGRSPPDGDGPEPGHRGGPHNGHEGGRRQGERSDDARARAHRQDGDEGRGVAVDARREAGDRHRHPTGGDSYYGLAQSQAAPKAVLQQSQYEASARAADTRERLKQAAMRKQQEEEEQRASRRHQKQQHQAGRMTDEERARKLAEMMANAEEHDNARLDRLTQAARADAAAQQGGLSNAGGVTGAAREGDVFLAAASRDVFGSVSGMSIEARINSRKHFTQR